MSDRIAQALALVEARASALRAQRQRQRMIKKLQGQMAKAFSAQGREVLKQLEDQRDAFPVREAFGLSTWSALWALVVSDTEELMIKPIQEGVETALVTAASQQIATFGASIAFDLQNPRAQAFLDGYAAAQVKGINDTTRDLIATILRDGLRQGLSYDVIADQIATRFEEFAGKARGPRALRSRAELVAVTEIGNAYSEGNRQGAQELKAAGLTMEKRWLTTGDDRVSAGCKENADAGWIGLDEEYPSGDQRPLRFPGCRCDEQYRRRRRQQGGN